jgi:hypothetical protein
VAEVKIETDPLLEVRAVAREHAPRVGKGVVLAAQSGRDGKQGLISVSAYLPLVGWYLARRYNTSASRLSRPTTRGRISGNYPIIG